jgi:hypothetical protein
MEYVLVALMLTSPGVYEFQTMAEYQSQEACDAAWQRAVKNGTTKMISLVCAKKDTI